jgi:subtilase family serine protease
MASAAVPAPAGSVRLGDLAPGTRLRVDVTLRLPHPAALAAFVAAVTNPRSPRHGEFLRRGQFGPRFGPTLAQVAAVRAALASEGLRLGPTAPDRLSIPVTAPASAIEREFGVSLIRYRLPGGRLAYANGAAPRLPASVAPYVSGVLGLSDEYLNEDDLGRQARPGRPSPASAVPGRARGSVAPDTAGPQPCAAASKAGAGHTINDFAARYWLSPLYRMDDKGGGVHVAVFEQEPDLASDIGAYEKCYGLRTAVNYLKVDGGAGTGAGSGEAALDIENIIGLSPNVTVDVYQGPNNSDTDPYDIYNAIVSADQDQVVSTSWGVCEQFVTEAEINDEYAVFEMAAAQGQTVVAAAGDSGSTACYQSDKSDGALSVQDPASQPDVVGVGGTTIEKSGVQWAWNDSKSGNGAGGGGLSSVWCMQGYPGQAGIPGMISGDSQQETCQTAPATTADEDLRQVPDVSAAASSMSSYLIYFKGAWKKVWGTSGAAPLWASAAALVDSSPFCSARVWNSGSPGALLQGLYFIAAYFTSYIYGTQPEGLADVTRGNDDYTVSGYTGGRYPTTTGYDMATGLGTPLVSGINKSKASTFYPGLAALMCLAYANPPAGSAQVTAISPRYGPRDAGQEVTVTGTGFVPIAGADFAEVDTTYVAATCASTTQCTFSVPKGPLGTVNIRINAEDLGPSNITLADQYRRVAAPTIGSLSPPGGRARGGNTVTIHGSGFYGSVTVHFGSKKATHVTVVSPTKVTVTAPSGSGTVKVTVSAAGGTSSGKDYRY